MNRALAVLTGGAYVVLLLELGQAHEPVAAVIVGAVFALLAIVGFPRVRRRGRGTAIAYFVVQLLLGYAVFGAGGGSTGTQLLLIVLVVQVVMVASLPWAVLVALLIPSMHIGMGWDEGIRAATGTFVAVLFAVVLTYLHLRERRARTELAEANERLRRYAAQVEELTATRERNRMARDIHDGLGHHLTVVQMQLQAARAVLADDPERAKALLEKAQQQSRDALADVRRSVAALREARELPLADALAKLAAESSEAGVSTVLEVRGSRRELSPETEESLFRVAQEGLTNVRKHANARAAQLLLDFGADASVRLEVRDDGCGLTRDEPPVPARGFGLAGLRERVAGLGGTLTTDAGDGRGLTLRVDLPA